MNQAKVLEKAVTRKIFLRLIPLLVGLYIISYLDRVNVGFAALTMNADIGLSASIYGLGAGLFFIGYCMFEVPSNILMVRFGARLWIARILLSWGIIATLMAFVQGPDTFLVLRFLLGVAEAGFFPAVIFYLTLWFPVRYRARIISSFMLSIPLALAIGAPVSTMLMQLNGLLGLKGWQWLFIIQGLPGILLVGVVLKYLPDSPGKAAWLNEREREWLRLELEKDVAANPPVLGERQALWKVFFSAPILALCFVYFCSTTANFGLSMFLPQILKQQGVTGVTAGFIMSIPYVIGCLGMLGFGYISDKTKKRKLYLMATMGLICVGMGAAGLLMGSIWAIVAISIGTIGYLGCKGPFWPLPSLYLSGANAAAGIALINSVGNLGGFFGPGMLGLVREMTGNYESGLYLMSLLGLLGVLVTAIVLSDKPEASAENHSEGALVKQR